MIPVTATEEPPDFDQRCRQRGNAWLDQNPDARRPKDLWSPFRPRLADSFNNRCAFAAMYIPSGTVDHFLSCDEDRTRAYEWSNFRYVDNWINSAKGNKKVADILDPFDMQPGWFEISLPSLQLVLTDRIPAKYRERAEKTLHTLPIHDDERLLRVRRQWLRLYEEGRLSLDGLREMAPLIAEAVERRSIPGVEQ
ncbi:hypothetical protein [Pseudomonas abieticivorans]|uniref:hypothetical protein n=1 Tax=Pseudomonas abieticivorans TaxID=2931382 RepID=UPI0020BE6AB5|nr:hypothetical protein [Pseudomonas sp. PIA16]